MSDTTETQTDETEDERSFRVRDVFAFRRPKTEGEPDTDAEETAEAPEPAPAATVPEQPKTLRIGDRAPQWWEPKPVISVGCQHPNPRTFQMAGQDERIPFWCPDCEADLPHDVPKDNPLAAAPTPAKECEHPAPHEVRNKVTGHLVAYWCADCETQLEVPDDYDELTDVTDEDGDGEEADDDGQTVDKVPPTIRQRWSQSIRGTGSKSYSRPVYGKDSAERKKSLIEVWGQMPRKTRHLLYNGTALGAGFYMGVPQFFTAEVAYLVDAYGSWTDFYVCIWYGVAAGIWALNYRTRGWFPIFAWLTRIPLVSMIVGALLYGTPAA